ncbi:MAG: potassium-transporting ATPase subunit C [Chloroflexi bacterium RBG_16_57_11]|nr:MAG: potassium-transporting ATPase subunit C [Chloroflexi bacterium RBG_16_57_11]
MLIQLKPALMLFVLLSLVTGMFYPLAVTAIAQVVFPEQANGSLIEENDKLLGSALIGQEFDGPQYFWSRPSATAGYGYNAFDPTALTGSSGSNLGPLSQSLVDSVRERVAALRASDPALQDSIPVDLVTASASGLDPHISIAAAYYQIPRVAQARGLSESQVRTHVDQFTTGRQFDVLGEPAVNVLLLNLALDEIK